MIQLALAAICFHQFVFTSLQFVWFILHKWFVPIILILLDKHLLGELEKLKDHVLEYLQQMHGPQKAEVHNNIYLAMVIAYVVISLSVAFGLMYYKML